MLTEKSDFLFYYYYQTPITVEQVFFRHTLFLGISEKIRKIPTSEILPKNISPMHAWTGILNALFSIYVN